IGDGTYTFSATAQDLAGNISAASAAVTITVDTTAPLVTVFRLADESAVSLGSNQSNQDTIKLVGKVEAGATVKLLATGQQLIADSNGDFPFTNVPLAYGTTTFTMTAADSLGNTRTVQTIVLRAAPTSDRPFVGGSLFNDTGLSLSDGITSDPT